MSAENQQQAKQPDAPMLKPAFPYVDSTDHVLNWNSEDLMRDQKMIRLRHGNEVYQLIVTSKGKLRLQK